MSADARLTRFLLTLGVALLLTACASSAPATPPPAPVDEEPPAETPPVVMEEPEPESEPATTASALVYGVDLDTVRAGRFDQGKMWTFEFPPVDYLRDEYGIAADDAWFERARLGALRIPSCSASFVSPHGLVLTNHHCAREFVSQVSGDGESLLDDGLVATDLADERPLEDFEADQLIDIVDVTDEVNSTLDALPADQRPERRESLLEEIEARLLEERGGEDAGYAVEMISLYNGGRTSGYVFRRYTDAKLVMAPELQLGFFGGDPDNFTYPRYNLDFAFIRIYDESGDPLSTPEYFPFDEDGLEEGDPIFIVGNPGSTSRLQTVAELEFRRDVNDRSVVELLRSRMAVLDQYIQAYPDEAEERDLRNSYFSLANSLKAIGGQIEGLQDPVILARRADTERAFQAAIEADPALTERFGSVIADVAALQESKREHAPGYGAFLALTAPDLASSTLYRALVVFQVLSASQQGAPAEVIEPLMEELRGVAQQPPELDAGYIEARIDDFAKFYGAESPLVTAVLGGMSAADRASAVIDGSMLHDSAGAVEAVEAGTVTMADPALGFVRSYLPAFIQFQQMVASVFPQEEALTAEVGRARYEVYGTDFPPDATFSLRLADGVVTGYDYNGTRAPAFTTFFGLYDRHYSHAGDDDWALPERWLDPPSTLDLTTPMNFVSTADIIGGNSGSPVLDADLEVVGVVFDGNIESLPGDYIYLPERNRSVTVDSRAILESLDEIYDTDRLVLELTTGQLVETEAEADPGR